MPTETPTLSSIPQERILRALITNIARTPAARGVPLWFLIQDVCAVTETVAVAICREMGLNPDEAVATCLRAPVTRPA